MARPTQEQDTWLPSMYSGTLIDTRRLALSSGLVRDILDGDEIIYGGEAVGYVMEFEDGVKIYHAGDTNVFGDMALIRDLYAPEIVMLPIGDLFTMSPREAAYACKLLKPKFVIPMHFGTFPPLTGRPDELQKLAPEVKVIEMTPGVTVS